MTYEPGTNFNVNPPSPELQMLKDFTNGLNSGTNVDPKVQWMEKPYDLSRRPVQTVKIEQVQLPPSIVGKVAKPATTTSTVEDTTVDNKKEILELKKQYDALKMEVADEKKKNQEEQEKKEKATDICVENVLKKVIMPSTVKSMISLFLILISSVLIGNIAPAFNILNENVFNNSVTQLIIFFGLLMHNLLSSSVSNFTPTYKNLV